MAWLIGIDEAGYGPNLGPLVMSSVAWRVPETLLGADLWTTLHSAVRRQADPADDRLVIDDSKEVHGSSGGLHALENNVLPAVAPALLEAVTALTDYVDRFCPQSHKGLCGECWYTGTTALPLDRRDELRGRGDRLAALLATVTIERGPLRSVAVCAPRFNALVEAGGSKGIVLAEAFTELLRAALREPCDGEPIHVFVDKHGGRNTYAAMLQHAVEEGMVIACQEGALCSRYQVLGLERDVFITFQPRADSEHLCVALASMASKYLRELFMLEFNRFWLEKVPGLAPTAGYPNDATRFLTAIRPAMAKLGLSETALWRTR